MFIRPLLEKLSLCPPSIPLQNNLNNFNADIKSNIFKDAIRHLEENESLAIDKILGQIDLFLEGFPAAWNAPNIISIRRITLMALPFGLLINRVVNREPQSLVTDAFLSIYMIALPPIACAFEKISIPVQNELDNLKIYRENIAILEPAQEKFEAFRESVTDEAFRESVAHLNADVINFIGNIFFAITTDKLPKISP